MKRLHLLLLVGAALATLAFSDPALAQRRADRMAARHAQGLPWHTNYYNTTAGVPIALVVPPTAHMQTRWSWGVSQNTMTPIYHQFRRTYTGGAEAGGTPLMPTPRWPSHTDQFGVNYVRGPW